MRKIIFVFGFLITCTLSAHAAELTNAELFEQIEREARLSFSDGIPDEASYTRPDVIDSRVLSELAAIQTKLTGPENDTASVRRELETFQEKLKKYREARFYAISVLTEIRFAKARDLGLSKDEDLPNEYASAVDDLELRLFDIYLKHRVIDGNDAEVFSLANQLAVELRSLQSQQNLTPEQVLRRREILETASILPKLLSGKDIPSRIFGSGDLSLSLLLLGGSTLLGGLVGLGAGIDHAISTNASMLDSIIGTAFRSGTGGVIGAVASLLVIKFVMMREDPFVRRYQRQASKLNDLFEREVKSIGGACAAAVGQVSLKATQ